MAVYHLSVSKIQRSAGRSSVAAAAYRAAESHTDERTGEHHDYTRKRGVEESAIFAPENAPAWARDRAKLWNEAEAAENRKNSVTAREMTLALPHELSEERRRELAHNIAGHLVERYGVAVDVNIHGPGKGGDERNHHAHLLFTTRRIGPDGFTEKTRELDDKLTGPKEIEHIRAQWELLANRALAEAGELSRIDHRTLTAQGIEDRAPTKHLGPAATAMERRGIRTEKGRWNRRVAALHNALRRAKKQEAAAKATPGQTLVESALRQTESQAQRKFEEGARKGAAVFETVFGKAKKPEQPEIHAKADEKPRRHDAAGGLGAAPPVQGAQRPAAGLEQGEARPSHQAEQLGQARQVEPEAPRQAQTPTQAQPLETQGRSPATQPELPRTHAEMARTQPEPGATQKQPEPWEHGEGLSVHRQGKFAVRPLMDGSGQAELLTRQKDASTGAMIWKPAKKPCVGSPVAVMEEAERRQGYIDRVEAGVAPPPGYTTGQDEQGRPIAVHPDGLFAVRSENPGQPGQLELLKRENDTAKGREAWRETGVKAEPRKVYVELGRQMELMKPGREAVSARNAAYYAAGRTAPAKEQSGQGLESLLDQVKRKHQAAEGLPDRAQRDAARLEVQQLASKLTPAESYSYNRWREERERQKGRSR